MIYLRRKPPRKSNTEKGYGVDESVATIAEHENGPMSSAPKRSSNAKEGKFASTRVEPRGSQACAPDLLSETSNTSEAPKQSNDSECPTLIDPIVSKESWSRLFTKPTAPRCVSHDEPCIRLQSKKKGFHLGREFWMCARPLGPSGNKERGTQWRCTTFIWASDWQGTNGSRGDDGNTGLDR